MKDLTSGGLAVCLWSEVRSAVRSGRDMPPVLLGRWGTGMSPNRIKRAGASRSFLVIGVAKSFERFTWTMFRHSGGSRNPVFSIPRSTRDWTPAFAGVTGGEEAITFGKHYKAQITSEKPHVGRHG